MNGLFPDEMLDTRSHALKPLADKLRPDVFSKVVGQSHLFVEDGPLHGILNKDAHIPSLIFWGPPGCGKTTIAKIIAKESGYHFDIVSAVASGTGDLRKLFAQAEQRLSRGQRTLVLVDEIHRFNRAQQDVFLPYIENGTIVLVGATTENPSFELNAALLSRCKVLVLHRLDNTALAGLVERVEETQEKKLPLTEDALETLLQMADGDGRYLLNMCEELLAISEKEPLDPKQLTSLIQKRMPLYDKSKDEHYNLISALHKSMRGSDVDAALYWLSRMLVGGEDPLYITRRLVRFAYEDIGMADPGAVHQALAAKDTYQFLGSPEGELALVQAVIYLATAPKSNAAYKASKQAYASAKQHGSHMPPKHILNAPTKLMKQEGYGEGYQYDHNQQDAFSGQNYFPDTMDRESYYQPVERGFEREIQKRLDYWQKLRNNVDN